MLSFRGFGHPLRRLLLMNLAIRTTFREFHAPPAPQPRCLSSSCVCRDNTPLAAGLSFLQTRRSLQKAFKQLPTFSANFSRSKEDTISLRTPDWGRSQTYAPTGSRGPHTRRQACTASASPAMATTNISYLTQEQAQQLDADLMGPDVGYSVDQLMELAGLSVAQAVADFYSSPSFPSAPTSDTAAAAATSNKSRKILVVCGPGNNGGDGLVAARHLCHFGFDVDTWYPKPGQKDLFDRLVKQLRHHKVAVFQEEPKDLSVYALVVDAIFGFSFKGALRQPFDGVLQRIKQMGVPVVAVDVPSGWDVEKGDVSGEGLKPVCLVSLTAPKLFAKDFKMTHYIGGRFVPVTLVEKYKLVLPTWPGTQQVVRIF